MASVDQNSTTVESGAPTGPPSTEFVQLFTRAQRPVFLYILSLIPRPVEAEEILQETNLVIWTKARQFQSGTNFRAWACQIAYFEVMKYRSRKHRDKLHFNPELLDLIATESLQQSELLDRRRQALAECLAKLREQDRILIQTRYWSGNNTLGDADAASVNPETAPFENRPRDGEPLAVEAGVPVSTGVSVPRETPGDTAMQGYSETIRPERSRSNKSRVSHSRSEGHGPEIAEKIGRPINSIYQSLSRIRKSLLECINRRLAAEARG